jgi:hypothetical protein
MRSTPLSRSLFGCRLACIDVVMGAFSCAACPVYVIGTQFDLLIVRFE